MRMYRNLLLVISFCLVACQQVPQVTAPKAPTAPALPQVDLSQVPAPAELTALTATQRQTFAEFVQRDTYRKYPMEERVGFFLTDLTMGFRYDGVTYTASRTMTANAGNCISLALLAKALADEAQVPISFRVTYRDPVLDIQNDLLISAAHVRSYLHGAVSVDENGKLQPENSVTIDYFKDSLDYLGPRISNDTFMAMVYNNYAAEALMNQDLVRAKAFTVAALKLDVGYAPSINMLAVVLRREGQIEQSTAWYEYGLERNPHNIMLLANYQLLATETANTALQQRLQQTLDQLPESDNPYAWYSLAVQAEQQGQSRQALHFYEKLLAKAPYLLPANQAMVRLLLQQNRLREAQSVLKKALEYSYTPEKRAIFEKKLAGLRKLQQHESD